VSKRLRIATCCAAGTALIASSLALAAPSTAPLRRVSPPHGGGYSLLLPSNWHFRDASYPSDHFTHLWYLPSNPLLKLEVVGSGCVGCVSKNLNPRIPDPTGELPQGVASSYRISPWVLAYTNYASDDPYPDNGLIIVTRYKGTVSGYERFDLWLPASQHKLATTILNSVKVAGAG